MTIDDSFAAMLVFNVLWACLLLGWLAWLLMGKNR